MSNLAAAALARPRFTFLAVLAVVLAGLWLVLDFPSTEEPPVTIRTATVLSYVPGANTERMEQLVGRPTEESILGLPEVKRVKTTLRPGLALSDGQCQQAARCVATAAQPYERLAPAASGRQRRTTSG